MFILFRSKSIRRWVAHAGAITSLSLTPLLNLLLSGTLRQYCKDFVEFSFKVPENNCKSGIRERLSSYAPIRAPATRPASFQQVLSPSILNGRLLIFIETGYLSGGCDGIVREWDVKSDRQVRTFAAAEAASVSSVCFDGLTTVLVGGMAHFFSLSSFFWQDSRLR